MRVLLTGASGWIGSALVPELLGAGHRVVGLARSEASAAALAAAGADVQRGDLDDLDGLRAAAAASEGVVHTAYRHDLAFSGDYQGAADADRRAIAALGEALAGSDRPFVVTSATGILAAGVVATEDGAHDPTSTGAARIASERTALAFADRGVRAAAVRLPPSVHGEGDRGFVATLVAVARERGASAFVGDGANRWPAVHRLDAARLYRLALEAAPAGSVAHAIADEGIPTRTIAEVIGRHLGLPVVAVPPSDAAEHFGWIAGYFATDMPASSTLTRERTGWAPEHPGLLDDLEAGHYLAEQPA